MKKLFLLFCTGFLIQFSYSQSGLIEFLKAGKEDANKLVKAYMDPYAFALGDGLNNGWYNTAATHNLFGFDLNLSVSAIQVSDNSKTFDLNSINFTSLSLENPNNHIAPTVAGKKITGPGLIEKDENGATIASFNSPEGLGLDIIPVPMIQVGYGLLPHTDIIGRYVPKLKYNNDGNEMKMGLWGVGIKHNFKEWIPFLKSLPFDASVFGSYSQMDAESALAFDPSDYTSGNITIDLINNYQMLKMKTNTSKFGLVLSKKLGMLTLFGGIGHTKSESNVDLIGKYVITTHSGIFVDGNEIVDVSNLNDPIDVKIESKNISLDAGLRLKFTFFSLFGSVNKAEYTSYNGGIGFSFR